VTSHNDFLFFCLAQTVLVEKSVSYSTTKATAAAPASFSKVSLAGAGGEEAETGAHISRWRPDKRAHSTMKDDSFTTMTKSGQITFEISVGVRLVG
jgi:hypothetical protein